MLDTMKLLTKYSAQPRGISPPFEDNLQVLLVQGLIDDVRIVTAHVVEDGKLLIVVSRNFPKAPHRGCEVICVKKGGDVAWHPADEVVLVVLLAGGPGIAIERRMGQCSLG